tara:strand:+ start:470 stop:631 length:162 start_codon:yes stop_codon:yes gene_type:complete
MELNPSMHTFLSEVSEKYNLPDTSKALRCLINFARENPEQHDTIFSEMRCMDC